MSRGGECQLDHPFSLNKRPGAFLGYSSFLLRKQFERILDEYASNLINLIVI